MSVRDEIGEGWTVPKIDINEYGAQGAKCGSLKEVTSNKIMKKMHELATDADNTYDRLSEKLQCVCMPAPPVAGQATKAPAVMEELYPSLFAEMRECLANINSSLRKINDVISRTEL